MLKIGIRRRLLIRFAAVALLSSAVPAFGFISTAGATVYIYGNANYSGDSGSFTGTNDYWGDFTGSCANEGSDGTSPFGWNDCVSSIQNQDEGLFVYKNTNCQATENSPYLYLSPDTDLANLTNNTYNNGDTANDSISSDLVGTSSESCAGVGV
jgi:hypothetical protein